MDVLSSLNSTYRKLVILLDSIWLMVLRVILCGYQLLKNGLKNWAIAELWWRVVIIRRSFIIRWDMR